ncbi:Rnase Y domain-containing protein, partial [Candidatus Parcubacteria bacterium]|nr:Rnase Y domain-containing protein [Candidatus Parcubacteria bacterium]
MSLKIVLLIAASAGVLGILIGWFLRLIISLGKRGSMELEIKQMMIAAKEQAQKITAEAEKIALGKLDEIKEKEEKKEAEHKRTEERLIKKEELLDKRQLDIDKEVENIKEKIEEIKKIREKAERLEADRNLALERVAGLTAAEAKEELFRNLEKRYEEDLLVRMQKIEIGNQERLDRKAKDILSTVIQRLASSTAAEHMVTSVQIPSEDIKGKIIGKEGRNIRAFERASGVELIVDDTPGSIVISSFDSVRRQIARVALEHLIADGRIQPAKIEEMVEKARQEISKIIKERGEAAMYECGLFGFDPKLVSILGRLHFRTSYGQNVLQHSLEMAHISG